MRGQDEIGDLNWVRESARCQSACPVGTNVPGYVALIEQGRFEEAYDLIVESNPLPSICGRVCHRPCEAVCRRGAVDAPVAIDALKRFVADRARLAGHAAPILLGPRRAQRVAIVGSGPAGLAAGYDLARLGYRVTLFEKAPVAGGMLVLGIPAYRLPRDILRGELEQIQETGVEIRTGVEVGRDLSFDELQAKHEAVLVAVGAQRGSPLRLPGAEGKGIIDALDFLREANLGRNVAVGRRVVVIGGGNTAVDAARMLWRSFGRKPPAGASVTIVYRRSRSEMPALAHEVDEALLEGVGLELLAAPVEVRRLPEGSVQRVVFQRMRLEAADASGRARPVPIPGSEFVVEADAVIAAVGLQVDLRFLIAARGEGAVERGLMKVDPQTLAAPAAGVFAAGDAVTGAATVIQAIAQGRRAALSIDHWLRGLPLEPTTMTERAAIQPLGRFCRADDYDGVERQAMPVLPVAARRRENPAGTEAGDAEETEVELGLAEPAATLEAARCLKCNVRVLIDERRCVGCGRCTERCPAECLAMLDGDGRRLHTSMPEFAGVARLVNQEACIRCGDCRAACEAAAVRLHRVAWTRAWASVDPAAAPLVLVAIADRSLRASHIAELRDHFPLAVAMDASGAGSVLERHRVGIIVAGQLESVGWLAGRRYAPPLLVASADARAVLWVAREVLEAKARQAVG